jgi:hypothetical protein
MTHRPIRLRIASLLFILTSALTAGVAAGEKPQVGDQVDLARFGASLTEDGIGVEWDEPRNIHQVQLSGVSAEEAKSLEVQWWGHVWPNGNRDPAGSGWMRLDDQWNGRWVRIAAEAVKAKDSDVWVFSFPAMTKDEWDQYLDPAQYLADLCAAFRRTFKVRVVSKAKQALPPTLRLQAFGDSRWQEASFDVDLRFPQDGKLAGRIDVTNGELVSIDSLPAPRMATVAGRTWGAEGSKGGSAGVRVRVRYVHNADRNSNDLTRITVRPGHAVDAPGFSFVPEDALAAGAMHLPDFGALVAPSEKGLSWANCPEPLDKGWGQRVRSRVAEHAEATRASAMAGIPRLAPPPMVPLGVPSARQEVFVDASGNWATTVQSLWFDNGRDYKRWGLDHQFGKQVSGPWTMLGSSYWLAALDTRAEPKFDGGDREDARRSLEDGYLPIIHVRWHTGAIHYRHVLTATALLGDYGDDVSRRGDETVVLLTRLEMSNKSDQPQPAAVNLRYSNNTPLVLGDDGVIALKLSEPSGVPEGLFAQRGCLSLGKPAHGGVTGWTVVKGEDQSASPVMSYRTTLQPGETRYVYFKAPFVDLLEKDELARLKEIDFEKESSLVREYWRKRLAGGMQIDVPDPAINNLYKANLWHVVISTDRDPETGLYNQPVGTVAYKVFANETIMIARSMDMRREHREAKRYIEPMLHYQGTEALCGRLSTKEGAFHSAGRYTDGSYTMNHGYVLWGAADHYFATRDRAYFERVAPQLIKGCDFIIRERRSTMGPPGSPRSPIHGLTPASSLEDVVEFKYWLIVNGYFYLGMKRTAEALADAGHPEARRIAEEAERYRRDIEAAARQAATMAAVVRLRDGTFIPYVPSRAGQWRHLTEGWIREALTPSLLLTAAEVVPPTDRLITWMLDELEDNIFFSAESGYNVTDAEKTWFERGGVTLQPCLVDTPPIYMARDEIPAALRAFWNTYAMSIHPDMQCFAEWVPRFGTAGGPLYKTSDEARFVIWLRQLLVWENGDQLWFGRATPREWLEDGKTVRIENTGTRFGAAGMVLKSEVAQQRIRASLQIPRQVPPKEVWLRLRHPTGQRPTRVLVNGRVAPANSISGEDIRLTPDEGDAAKQVEIVAEYQP